MNLSLYRSLLNCQYHTGMIKIKYKTPIPPSYRLRIMARKSYIKSREIPYKMSGDICKMITGCSSPRKFYSILATITLPSRKKCSRQAKNSVLLKGNHSKTYSKNTLVYWMQIRIFLSNIRHLNLKAIRGEAITPVVFLLIIVFLPMNRVRRLQQNSILWVSIAFLIRSRERKRRDRERNIHV